MTETTKTIFDKYEVRKTRKQKAMFRDYAVETAQNMGYTATVEKGLGAKNIIVGNPETAKVIYTAHYDTCPALPFPNFITPKNIGLYILYNIGLVLGIFIVVFGICFGVFTGLRFALSNFDLNSKTVDITCDIIDLVVWLAVFLLIYLGPANKHTANDNTSGVTALFDIMAALPEELRGKVAFIFFDCEEQGMFGSSAFASKHKEIKKTKTVINFDCVSDGENFIFAVRKKADKAIIPLLKQAYKSDKFAVEVLDKGVIYPSDQLQFKNGVGVAALKKSKGGILYMNRIHTKKDTIYNEENIEFLVNGSVKLAEII